MKSAGVVLLVAVVLLVMGAPWSGAAGSEESGAALWPMDIPEKVGEIPTDPVGFCRWVIVDRARDSLKRVQDSQDGLIYGAAAEDANVAWILACAYNGKGWSPLYHDAEVLKGAFRLMDAITEVRLKEPWEKGRGHGPRFGLHSYANAVAFWKETGAVPPDKLHRWIECVRKSADFCIRYDARELYVGDYANPEMYSLSGLAVAWQLTGEERYRKEAAATLRRYEDDTFPDGGVSYFMGVNAETSYQQMVVKSVCRYYEITKDPYAKELLERYADYFPLIWLPAGIHSPSEQPWLKHYVTEYINPAVADMLASFTGDGRNATIARVQAYRTAQQIAGQLPSFMQDEGPYAWYNYHWTTYACLALRYHREVEPQPVLDRWVGPDENLRGIRSRWGNWTAFATSRRASMTLTGCLIADPAEPFYPLQSGLLLFLCEYGEGKIRERDAFGIDNAHHIMNEWNPVHYRSVGKDGAILNVFSELSSPYWGGFPESNAEYRYRNPAAWEYSQAWITWKNSLIGLVRMVALRDSDAQAQDCFVRLRPVFIPQNRELRITARGNGILGSYGRLGFAIAPLGKAEGWRFGQIDNRSAPPFLKSGTYCYTQPRSPVLQKSGSTWKRGDTVTLWTAYWDTEDAAFDVSDPDDFRVLFFKDRAAAVVVRESEKSAVVFVADLNRRWIQLQLDPAEGWQIQLLHTKDVLPTFAGEPVRFSLLGFQTAMLHVKAERPLAATEVAGRLRVTGGRWMPAEPWTQPY